MYFNKKTGRGTFRTQSNNLDLNLKTDLWECRVDMQEGGLEGFFC